MTVALGDNGRQLGLSSAAGADGVAVSFLGAGRGSPRLLEAIASTVRLGVPVVLTCRPRLGRLLRRTRGFQSSEQSMRATGAISAGTLPPAAAHVLVFAGIGSRLDRDSLAETFARFD